MLQQPWATTQDLRDHICLLEDKISELEETIHSKTNKWGPVRLTTLERRMLDSMPFFPRVITREFLHFRMYEDHGKEIPESRTLDVFLWKLRKKLSASQGPYWIQTVWGGGYSLHKVAPEFWDKVETPLRIKLYFMTPDEILQQEETTQ